MIYSLEFGIDVKASGLALLVLGHGPKPQAVFSCGIIMDSPVTPLDTTLINLD